MKNLLLLTIVILFTSILTSAPIDTGMIEWQQPNEVTFIAQMIGDEFSFKFTTDDGYEIREGTDGWFYYAVLDENDNLVPSNSKVGIDEAPEESYRLELPGYKLAEIENYKQQFNQQLLEAEEWFRQKRIEANGGTVTLKIGVILVDFADNVHYRGGNFPDGYHRELFNDMIFSNNGDWFDPDLPTNGKHPENKQIYGSLRDYYNQQSRGKLDIIGKDGIYPEILNPPDPLNPAVPDWVYLSETKSYWESQPLDNNFWDEAKQKFQQKFPSINLSIYDRFIFIYAGKEPDMSGYSLWPKAWPFYASQMSEQWKRPGGSQIVFSHIGNHAHEFGHIIGAQDEYDGNLLGWNFDLMSYGFANGPERKGECPSGITPFYRVEWGWVNVTYLNENSYTDFLIVYNYLNPVYYRLDNPYDETEYFLIENRLREGFDIYTPNDPNYIVNDPRDLNGNLGGLLIWTIDLDNGNHDKTGLKVAAINYFSNNQASIPFPYNGTLGGSNLTSATNPNNSIRNVTDPGVLFTNIRWITPANNILVNISHDYSANYIVVSSNQTWNNTRTFDKNLLILGEVTLTLQEGAVLKFYSQKKLQVLNTGTLNIQSSGNPIELTNYTFGQKWNGIELNGFFSELQGSNYIIRNTNQAIKFQRSRNISFSNVKLEDNNYSLILTGFPENPSQFSFINSKLINSPISLFNTNTPVITLSLINCFVENSIITTQFTNVNLDLVNTDFKSNSNITLSSTNTNTIKNNIFYNSNITNSSCSSCIIIYNCIFPNPPNPSLYSQVGNFSTEPYFLTSGNGSQLFEYSPCIDAGDPSSTYSNEPGNNGGRINIGSLGNTSSATQVNPLVPQVLSGSNVTFLGNYFFNPNSKWNINNTPTLLSNAQLLINPGVKLNFNNGSSLMVYGTLNALGIETNKITFDRIGTSGAWGNIVFSGTGSSNSILDYVEITNGTSVMCLNNADVTIQNSKMANCIYGVYIYNSEPEIISNEIIEPLNNGIYGEANGKSPLIKSNKIKKTSSNSQYHHYQGIYFLNSTNPFITQNDIQGFYYGVYFAGGGSGYFTDLDFNTPEINNRLTGNQIGMTVAWGSYFSAGSSQDPSFGGNNSFGENLTYDATAYQSGIILASQNWWGSDGIQIDYYTNGYIDIDYELDSDPWESIPLRENKVNTVSTYVSAPKTSKPSVNESLSKSGDEYEDIIIGQNLEKERRIQQSVQHYKQMLERNNHPKYALYRLIGIKKRFSLQNIHQYLEELLETNNQIKATILNILAGECIDDEKFNKAMILYNRIIEISGSEYDGINARFGKFFNALHNFNDITLASQLLEEIRILGLDNEDVLMRLEVAENLLNNSGIGNNKFSKSVDSKSNVEVLNDYSLSQNYPNPFNPSTIINYSLKNDGRVILKIFNTLGEEIRTLVNEIKSEGSHYAEFDASQLPTGVYIYQIRSGDFVSSKKMMLIK